MPFYKYVCENCKEIHEIERKISEYNPNENCPICNQPMKRDIGNLVCGYECRCGGFYGKTST